MKKALVKIADDGTIFVATSYCLNSNTPMWIPEEQYDLPEDLLCMRNENSISAISNEDISAEAIGPTFPSLYRLPIKNDDEKTK